MPAPGTPTSSSPASWATGTLLYGHIIHQNNPLIKPDFMLVFSDPYLRPCLFKKRQRGTCMRHVCVLIWAHPSGAPRQADLAWLVVCRCTHTVINYSTKSEVFHLHHLFLKSLFNQYLILKCETKNTLADWRVIPLNSQLCNKLTETFSLIWWHSNAYYKRKDWL